MKRKIKLILWDFGGVLTESPIKKFKEFEKNNKIPIGTIVNINSNNKYDNAWAKLEKNLINKKQFSKLFLKEAKNLNIEEELNIDEILACLNVDLNLLISLANRSFENNFYRKTTNDRCIELNKVAAERSQKLGNFEDALKMYSNLYEISNKFQYLDLLTILYL